MILPSHLEIGTLVFSMYKGISGVIIEIVSTFGFQDEYKVRWQDGTVSNVMREEVY